MASSQPPTATPIPNDVLLKPTGNNIDMAWEWNHMKDLNNKKSVTCNFCGHISTGGITKAKKHQMGVTRDVSACKEIPADIKQHIMDVFMKKKSDRDTIYGDLHGCFGDAEAEMQEIADLMANKQLVAESTRAAKRTKSTKGPMDLIYQKAQRQSSINDAIDKEARARTVQFIARFFYKCRIPFNVVRDRSFSKMMDVVANYGPNLKLPTYHELRVPLLQKEVELTKEMMKPHIIERAISGCSIMSDAWTDRKGRTLINFMVNCPLGTMFVKSVDASGYMKTGDKLAELLDCFICEIGEENVVQVVTNNGSNYVLAGKYLEARRRHIFWTPCAAYCVDLMLEDIGKLERVKRAIQRGSSLVSFIYNHTMTLNTMRKFTKKTELVRAGVTRFATNFLTLQRLHDQKGALRKMFTSDEWMNSNAAKDAKGKRAFDI
ncbi:PREDICTED: uncharacterized protein LOC109343825 [Lupinus angustifolius]|uniref:uncharacterized protein LOC109343825 n=1 Tax=Lupinus angustifolius TaxID=3871 RepID=UPI00092F7A35|nr:PREDICTED: uncharacterized protein LOC109343825 [Lupinus angustifolius]